jgi:hypothetical protein
MSDLVHAGKLLTLADLVRLSGRSISTIQRARLAGKIPFRRIGHLVRFTGADCDAFLVKCAKKPKKAEGAK